MSDAVPAWVLDMEKEEPLQEILYAVSEETGFKPVLTMDPEVAAPTIVEPPTPSAVPEVTIIEDHYGREERDE